MKAIALPLLACLISTPADSKTLRVLFIGNSHTYVNNVPQLVKNLIESDKSRRTAEVQFQVVGFLDEVDSNEAIKKVIRDGKWDFVVLQAAKVSSSHKYDYPQDHAIAAARLAKQAGARVLLFVEWPRQGWNESDFQYAVYKKIAEGSGAELLPICYAWDAALRQRPNLDMWNPDGNHAHLAGSYLAACVIYYHLAGTASNPTWGPNELDGAVARFLLGVAKQKH